MSETLVADPGYGTIFGSCVGEQREIARQILHWAQHGHCSLCGDPLPLTSEDRKLRATFDHIIPTGDGGGDDLFNLALAHYRCNNERARAPLTDDQRRRLAYRAVRLQEIVFNLGLRPSGPSNVRSEEGKAE